MGGAVRRGLSSVHILDAILQRHLGVSSERHGDAATGAAARTSYHGNRFFVGHEITPG
jgi:hypothetical protein